MEQTKLDSPIAGTVGWIGCLILALAAVRQLGRLMVDTSHSFPISESASIISTPRYSS